METKEAARKCERDARYLKEDSCCFSGLFVLTTNVSSLLLLAGFEIRLFLLLNSNMFFRCGGFLFRHEFESGGCPSSDCTANVTFYRSVGSRRLSRGGERHKVREEGREEEEEEEVPHSTPEDHGWTTYRVVGRDFVLLRGRPLFGWWWATGVGPVGVEEWREIVR